MKLKDIASRPLGLVCSIFGKTKSKNDVAIKEKLKPQEVIVVPTRAGKAAMYRDWAMAFFFGIFAGFTIYEKVFKDDRSNNVDRIIKSLDLNNDGHISKEELETVKELLGVIEKSKEKK